jgi:pimeloyl-ACP methyl ester carboxylesterase
VRNRAKKASDADATIVELAFTPRWQRRLGLVGAAFALAAGVVCASCVPAGAPLFSARLHPCASTEGPTDGYCGGFEVYENREAASGRTIRLAIVVLPSVSSDVHADPLVFLAGGPGQSAAQMASLVQPMFRKVQRTRDIVLVDQRGTGKSNPLNCRAGGDSLRDLTESDASALDDLRACLARLPGDPRFYTTNVAMDDLDDVRAFLGYDAVNLYGGSYGTRAALVYLRRHGGHVRSIVLDGVAPMDMRLPMYAARDAQRALDKPYEDCLRDDACRAAYPRLAERTRQLFVRLDARPPRLKMAHPRTGVIEEINVTSKLVASIMFQALYSPLTASILPSLIERAEHDDFQGLLALAFAGESATDAMSLGMQLSVLCSEDSPRYAREDIAREAAGTLFGTRLLSGQVAACEFWPKGRVDTSYYAPVVSAVPALVLSGELDPVTPPTWGLEVAKHLRNGRHLVMPGTGHGVAATACGNRLVTEFIEQGDALSLDAACVRTVQRPGFFLTPAGPEAASVALASAGAGARR